MVTLLNVPAVKRSSVLRFVTQQHNEETCKQWEEVKGVRAYTIAWLH